MMIVAALALAALDTRPVAKGMEVPNAIIRQHDAYVACQDANFDIGKVGDQRTFIAEVEKAIAACKERKAALTHDADKILASAPDYSESAKLKWAICEAFDSYDELRRAMARSSADFKETCK